MFRRAVGRQSMPLLIVLAAVTATVPLRAHAASHDEASLISLEARAQELSRIVGTDRDATVTAHLARAGRAWAHDIPLAAALYNIALGHGVGGQRRVQVLIEAARAEAAFGQHDAAMRHFLTALGEGRQAHHITSAFEGFVAVAEQAKGVPDLPDARRYAAALAHRNKLDSAAQEAIYRLARLLVRRTDPRAEGVLTMITEESLTYRRALYMRGVHLLQRQDLNAAVSLFEQAARLDRHRDLNDEAGAQDDEVRELSWLAMGRLAFERGQHEQGLAAYQQIPASSRHFNTAVFELGWLALEAEQHEAALSAFRSLENLPIETQLGRRALLIRGFVMILNGRYEEAERYYRNVAQRFGEVLARYDSGIRGVTDLADLAQDCQLRTQAMDDPLLAPMLGRPEAQAAWKLTQELEELHRLASAIDQQVQGIDRALASEGSQNPFAEIERDRQAVREAIERIQDLSSSLDLRQWQGSARVAQSSPVDTTRPCCKLPKQRARQLRERFEKMLTILDEREQQLRQRLLRQRQEIAAIKAVQKQTVVELEPSVRIAQREALVDATQRHRAELLRMVMEGDAGALEAIWRFKEVHREQIANTERERREKLLTLEAELIKKLTQLDTRLYRNLPEPGAAPDES